MHQATGSPIAAEALSRIGELYAIETSIRGQSADTRQIVAAGRDDEGLVRDEAQPIPPRSGLADATRYALTRWDALGRFPR